MPPSESERGVGHAVLVCLLAEVLVAIGSMPFSFLPEVNHAFKKPLEVVARSQSCQVRSLLPSISFVRRAWVFRGCSGADAATVT